MVAGRPLTMRMSCSTVAGSLLAKGSSKPITRGCMASTVARATRRFRRRRVHEWSAPRSFEPQLAQAGLHAASDLRFVKAEIARAEGDILKDGGREELIFRVLKDDADLCADGGEVARGDGRASMETAPSAGSRTPLRWSRKVDLPAPEWPMMPRHSPGSMVRDTRSSARRPSG